MVGRLGVGYDNLAPELLREHGVIGFNVPDYCIDEVATHVAADLMEAYGVRKVGFEELLEQSDALLLHCPLSGETAGMLDAAAFARMKPGAVLVNTARGALIEPRALRGADLRPPRRRRPGRVRAGRSAPGRVVWPRGAAP